MNCSIFDSRKSSSSSAIEPEDRQKHSFPLRQTTMNQQGASGIHSHSNSFAKGFNSSQLQNPLIRQGVFPRSPCIYHPDLFITNFCRSSNCQIPLCPECVKMHTGEHRAQGTYGDFERIEKVQSEAIEKMEALANSYSESERKVQEFSKKHYGNEKDLRSKLEQARSKLQQMVNNFIDVLGRELALRWKKQRAFFDFELQNVAQKVSSKQKAIEKQRRELGGESHLRYLIGLQTSDFYEENADYSQKLEEYLKLLDTQMLDLIEDENSLYTLNLELAKYLTIRNADLYQTGTGSSPLSERNRLSASHNDGEGPSLRGRGSSKSTRKDHTSSISKKAGNSRSKTPKSNRVMSISVEDHRHAYAAELDSSSDESKSSIGRQNSESFEASRGEITSTSVNVTPPRNQLASNHEFKHNPAVMSYHYRGQGLPADSQPVMNYSLSGLGLEYEGVPGVLFNSTNLRPNFGAGPGLMSGENEQSLFMMRKRSSIFD